MQEAFIFMLFILNSSTSTSQDDIFHRRFSLGCEAVIPCQNYRVHSSHVKYLYKRETHGEVKTVLVIDKGGLLIHSDTFHNQVRVGANGSLIIKSFTEDNEGLYWCVCCAQNECKNDIPTRVKKEILKESFETVYVSAGANFTFMCPGNFPNTKWTFEAINKSSLRNLPGPQEVISNKSIHIKKVNTKHAGKYTCSVTKCSSHFVKHVTLTLYVTENKCENSSHSGSVCDLRFNNSELHVTNEHSCGSLNCSSEQSGTSNNTTAPHEYQITLIYVTLGAFVCFFLMTLISCLIRLKLQTAHWHCPSRFGTEGTEEEEASVVYSSIIIMKPTPMTNSGTIPTCTQEDCVYTQIKPLQQC